MAAIDEFIARKVKVPAYTEEVGGESAREAWVGWLARLGEAVSSADEDELLSALAEYAEGHVMVPKAAPLSAMMERFGISTHTEAAPDRASFHKPKPNLPKRKP
jgi:hypothetical protein